MLSFYMLYQPKFQQEKLISVEALLRTEHFQGNIEDYIHHFKAPIELDRKVITQVLIDIKPYIDKGIYFSINVIYFSLIDDDFIVFFIFFL